MLTVSTSCGAIETVPYRSDPLHHYRCVADLPDPVLLDSGGPHGFDIIAAAPLADCCLHLPAAPDAAAVAAFFAGLEARHGARPPVDDARAALPFAGGLIGFIGYDATLPLHGLTGRAGPGSTPAAVVNEYPWAVVQDRSRREAWLVARPGLPAGWRRELLTRLRDPSPPPTAAFQLAAPFEADMDAEAYREAFDQVQRFIGAGDCYQVNLALRFSAPFSGNPLGAYALLQQSGSAHFGAYFPLGPGRALLSRSPERFLAVRRGVVTTEPIKGTRPRSADAAADRATAQELMSSDKDRAENLMIVDLLRNDLGRNCRPGSIRVEELFALRSFPAVHHLVSTVRGELAPGQTPVALLRDSLPGGSITGAPKRRAMEIIHSLERAPRQAYCGSLFYLDDAARMDSSILIRSLLAEDGQLHCWGGGGVVADSVCEAEHREIYDKVGGYLRTLETTAQ
ncbi:anthranilate synthase component I family protein [Pseudohaliea rubra]|uniref:Para-aminobenzoate synthase, aminase component n=1 Tax=Pseudohaliea rubra DSM 19751 TaxID=1265313 RepID=A0A095VQ43_9GAMM|nr:anthranilate synthase component I family protein [Pseudohaliea rubra]KGE03495.1 Para-aminobenzoate synthase, aminase component [Pseudohaliea rubra DSM 19751]